MKHLLLTQPSVKPNRTTTEETAVRNRLMILATIVLIAIVLGAILTYPGEKCRGNDDLHYSIPDNTEGLELVGYVCPGTTMRQKIFLSGKSIQADEWYFHVTDLNGFQSGVVMVVDGEPIEIIENAYRTHFKRPGNQLELELVNDTGVRQTYALNIDRIRHRIQVNHRGQEPSPELQAIFDELLPPNKPTKLEPSDQIEEEPRKQIQPPSGPDIR